MIRSIVATKKIDSQPANKQATTKKEEKKKRFRMRRKSLIKIEDACTMITHHTVQMKMIKRWLILAQNDFYSMILSNHFLILIFYIYSNQSTEATLKLCKASV